MDKTIKLLKMRLYVIFIPLFTLSGCFSQYKMDFDFERQALATCDERIIIKNVRIMEADSYNVIYQLHLKKDSGGSHIIYLTGKNKGYDTGSSKYLELEPNTEYVITSAYGDSSLKMRVFTNSESKIDSVFNKFKCLN